MVLEKLGIPDNIIYSAKKLWDETLVQVDYQYDDLIKEEERLLRNKKLTKPGASMPR